MKKHKRLIIVMVAVFLVSSIGIVALLFAGGFGRFTDGCTKDDWANGNCTPAGHCGPEGSIVDQTADCAQKKYDSRFCHDSLEVCKNTIY